MLLPLVLQLLFPKFISIPVEEKESCHSVPTVLAGAGARLLTADECLQVSGLHVRMNRDVIEVLVSTESPPQKDRRDVREARVGGVEGERAGVGTTAVKIHLQNFTVRLGAGFGDKDGGRYGDKDGGRYGEMRFEMAKGVVQVVKEQRTHVTIELDRPSHELHHPCVSVGYLEWPGSEHDIYPRLADISQGENASEFSLRMPSQTPDFEHLFFCLHSLTLDYTSGGGGVAGGGIMHSSPGESFGHTTAQMLKF